MKVYSYGAAKLIRKPTTDKKRSRRCGKCFFKGFSSCPRYTEFVRKRIIPHCYDNILAGYYSEKTNYYIYKQINTTKEYLCMPECEGLDDRIKLLTKLEIIR